MMGERGDPPKLWAVVTKTVDGNRAVYRGYGPYLTPEIAKYARRRIVKVEDIDESWITETSPIDWTEVPSTRQKTRTRSAVDGGGGEDNDRRGNRQST